MDDILDIDELTKDDSFFLEAKDHDVCNIIQQWKNNNNNTVQQQQQQAQNQLPQSLQSQQQQQKYQQNNEKAYKVNSRTFTRPKRKSAAQNLESQFNGISEQHQQSHSPQYPLSLEFQNPTPMLNVQIGGKVRTPLSARSMLQDTSPPSSMDVSMEYSPMDNSLVTSADFTNISFMLSTPSLEADKLNNESSSHYTLNDMIRDRKALESLTLSTEDGTLIKDSQIAQVDDISLTLWKASSGSSTMDNSTESVEGNGSGSGGDGTIVLQAANATVSSFDINDRTIEATIKNSNNFTFTSNGSNSNPLQQTMVLSNEEIISDTTFSLIENGQSFLIERDDDIEFKNDDAKQMPLNEIKNLIEEEQSPKNTDNALNETVCIQSNNANAKKPTLPLDVTYDNHLMILQATPEDLRSKFEKPIKHESTPQGTRANYAGIHAYIPTINMISEAVDISPIISCDKLIQQQQQQQKQQPFNETYEMNTTKNSITADASYIGSPLSHLNDKMEMLENIENPNTNETFKRRFRRRSSGRRLNLQQEQEKQQELDLEQARLNKSVIEMQDVMDLVEAEAELLEVTNDGVDDEFEHMLDEFSRVELNAEQLKMKKSLESIKKRFNCTIGSSTNAEREISNVQSNSLCSGEVASSKTFTSETREEALRHLRDEMSRNRVNNTINCSIQCVNKELGNSTSSNGGGSFTTASSASMATSGERLLSRRSRLYDDINLSTLTNSLTQNVEETTTTMDNIAPMVQPSKTTTTTAIATALEATEAAESATTYDKTATDETLEAAKYKLSEKRERDRERFRTMKIVKNLNGDDGVGSAEQNELNVPCIDDDDDDCVEDIVHNQINQMDALNLMQQRSSRRDMSNVDEVSQPTRTVASKLQNASNFLTYKKPKEKHTETIVINTTKLNRPEIANVVDINNTTNDVIIPSVLKQNGEVRSLSRPRYISGLQKFSVVSKAVSAGDLEKTEHNATAAAASAITAEGKAMQQLTRINANIRKTSNLNGNVSKVNGVANNATTMTTATATTTKQTSELKSPMGLKAKSLHNLSSNLNYTAFSTGIAAPSRIGGTYGLRKINSGGISNEQQQQIQKQQQQQQQKMPSAITRPQKTQPNTGYMQKQNTHFKKPQAPVSGLRPTSSVTATTRASAGIARPSSGYFSLNATTKIENLTQGNLNQTYNSNDDIKASRSITPLNTAGKIGNNVAATASEDSNQITRITIGASGIPKPSGLRPPSKRSGLPMPSSIVRR